jgi:peroxiredoxin
MRRLGLTVLLAVGLVTGAPPAASRGVELGQLAPDLALPDLDGRVAHVRDFAGKRGVLLNFWATWCVPCREEMPTLERISHERRETLVVLGINLDPPGLRTVRAFVQELKLTFPILLDPKFEAAKTYRVRAIPTSFVLDRQGIVRYREIGYRTWTDAESRYILNDALRPR